MIVTVVGPAGAVLKVAVMAPTATPLELLATTGDTVTVTVLAGTELKVAVMAPTATPLELLTTTMGDALAMTVFDRVEVRTAVTVESLTVDNDAVIAPTATPVWEFDELDDTTGESVITGYG